MVSGVINMSDAAWRELRNHLLPPNCQTEEGAFLMARCKADNEKNIIFQHVETVLLGRRDFISQENDYLELSDETRARLIKRAHDLDSSLIEFHSHPGPYPACLSPADMRGLREFVPHVIWRLKQRPYAAVVVANSGFDGLIWAPPVNQPLALKGLQIGDKLLHSTGLSLQSSSRRIYEKV